MAVLPGGFYNTGDSYGAKGWSRAALELRQSPRAAEHVPLQGSGGRVSTSWKTVLEDVRGVGEAVEATGGGVRRQDVGERARAPGTEEGERQEKVGNCSNLEVAERTDLMREPIVKSDMVQARQMRQMLATGEVVN
ncbi:hypothetical protein NDU88_006779 [Pleurodeles waltl]|uniref:Uncharacterized protein n=1 Tax=Pleurodeles waltl TaxID=8319 RepID=A0AAV7N074_PLEWA|nr:hypothetical protein NDU88_006779 [Pleurodeles waltl]